MNRERLKILVRPVSIVVLALFLLAGCGEEGVEVKPQEQRQVQEKVYRGTIVAAGDSLTAGYGVAEELSYPALLEQRLVTDGLPYRVINAGVSGETTSGFVSRLDWLMTMKPDIVIIETGANDGLRGIDIAVPQKNLRRIVEYFQDKGVIIVFTGMKMVVNLGPEYRSAFDQMYPQIAREYGLIFMPFFLEGVAAQPQYNIDDGIHPNSAGYEIITDNLYPFVIEAIRKHEEKEQ